MSSGIFFQGCPRSFASIGSGRDGDLQHTIALVREQIVGLLDLLELEAMRHQTAKINATRGNHVEHTPHPFLATGTQRRPDGFIAKPRGESVERDLEVG